ncbi:MAG: hypothetical protein JWM11_2570 [Planctomycetaceae bacterium]|nr:hypothetical protein [Planctomycetaceae bacterium]
MQHILQDMLIWLVSFFGISAAVLCVVRWGMFRLRKQREERLRLLENRCREMPDRLGLPLIWVQSKRSSATSGDRLTSILGWILGLGSLIGGVTWTGLRPDGGLRLGLILGGGIGIAILLAFSLWLYCRRAASMPAQVRRLAAALRCWAIRLGAGVERRLALEQTARQLQRLDPDMARCLEAAAISVPDREAIHRALYPCGAGVSDRLTDILTGKVPDVLTALRSLADQLDEFYQNQLLIRVKRVDGWLKYPIALCLVPALNLMAFGPAISDLIDNVGILDVPVTPAVRPVAPPEERVKI